MSSRFLIPALCIGAIVLACGPRAHNEASAPRQNDGVAKFVASAEAAPLRQSTPRTAAVDARSSRSPVTAQLYVHAADSNIRLALHVINTSKKRVELTFPSGQTYDFVILDSLGREMWRWGSGRMFTQALRNTLLGAGEALELQETWKAAPLSPGRYTARAVLKSANFPIVQQAEFSINATIVATR